VLSDQGRDYLQCSRCALIFVDPAHRLTAMHEVLRYLEHRNSASDEGYVRFLSRLGDPVRERLTTGARGIDFGCGPAPVLGDLLTAQGFPTVSHDPLFRPNDASLRGTYDFATCSEVVEHAHRPLEVFAELGRLVRSGGVIGVMTRFHGLEAPFAKWWYRRDPTHVCFYDARTMAWIAGHFDWTLELPAPHVALFRTD
jgi:SAM-dependent methyltransferase